MCGHPTPKSEYLFSIDSIIEALTAKDIPLEKIKIHLVDQ